jgi:cobalt-zinc-cadmium efflux system protein
MEEHDHHHHNVTGKNLFVSIVLNLFITTAQIIGGIVSGSLALLSDALHNFSDVMALLIAWWANKISSKESSEEKTFGYKRAEIVAALFNASVLVGIGVYLIVEGVAKLMRPEAIDSDIVIYLALLGIVFNFISVLLLQKDAKENLNMKAAYLHLLSDTMTSVAVLIGGLGMKYFGAFWIDPFITIVIALYLIQTSFSLIKETTSILMQFSPKTFTCKRY